MEAWAKRSVEPRLVEVEDGGLGEEVGRAEAGRVQLVALDLGRPPQVALDQHPRGVAAERHGGGVVERLAGNELLRRADIGEDFFRRLARAGAQARERQRGRHQLQEAPPPGGVGELAGLGGKLAVKHFLEFWRLGQLLEAAPVVGPAARSQAGAHSGEVERRAVGRGAHRWHPEQ